MGGRDGTTGRATYCGSKVGGGRDARSVRRGLGNAAVGNAQGNRDSVCIEVEMRFPSHGAREERGAHWKNEAFLESVVCASGKQMMVSTSCWQCDTCTSAVLRLGMGARDGAPRVVETRGDARWSLPKESGMDRRRWTLSGGSETWGVRATRESSLCDDANSAGG